MVADFANVEFTLTHSIFSVNVSLRLPGLSSGFRIKKRKETILLGFADSTKMAGNSRLGRGTKPNKRILSDFMDAKGRAQQGHPLKFDSAESFDPESFDLELTTEGLVAGCGSLFGQEKFLTSTHKVAVSNQQGKEWVKQKKQKSRVRVPGKKAKNG